jgi:hypothetical protein
MSCPVALTSRYLKEWKVTDGSTRVDTTIVYVLRRYVDTLLIACVVFLMLWSGTAALTDSESTSRHCDTRRFRYTIRYDRELPILFRSNSLLT